MERQITELKDHYIICGFGRVGHQVAVELAAARIPFVVVDSKPETAEELGAKNIPYIIGDITTDKVLIEAGIKKAKGLIASADSDTANVFVTLSARVLNPKLNIIARASSVDAEEKMKKAGADRVISPYFIAGKRMAAVATKPTAIDFLDTVMHSEHVELEMREFKINGTCSLSNRTLGEAQIRQKSGAYVATIRKPDGTFNLQPSAETKLEPGDTLVAIGTPQQLELFEKCIG
jgi:voltage-gated potassium channel